MSYYYNPGENLSVDHLSGERGVTQKIKGAMKDAARQFVYIGFLLWEVKQYEYFYEGNYSSVYEYAEAELGFKRSSTKNFIAICENFCRKSENFKGLPTMHLDDRWSDFQYSQLTEMLSMSPGQRAKATPDMTVKQLRQLKKPVPTYTTVNEETGKIETIQRPEEGNGQTSGQEKPEIDWISVNKGLPEPDKRVLVTCETKKGDRNINLAYWDGNAWHGNGSMAGVTHWMELPAFPMLKREQEATQTILVNNYWDDVEPTIIRRLIKKARLKYNPHSCYKITIELHKG